MNTGASFLFFLVSITFNTIALNCIRFGVSWMVMREANSAVAFAAIFSASSLVEVYSKPVLSPLADYFDTLRIYRMCVILASIVLLVLLMAVVLLPFSIPILTASLMALSLVAGLRDPASAALVPALVRADRLTEAQSLRSSVSSVVGLGAPMLSAMILAAGGASMVIGAAAIACVLGLMTTLGVKILRIDALAAPRHWGEYLKTWHLRTADGMRAVVMTRSERTTAVVVALTNAGLFPFFMVALPLWVTTSLGASASTMAIIEVAFSVGILIGSVFLTTRLNIVLGRFKALVVGNGLLGGGILTSILFVNPASLALCFVISGAGFAVFNVNASTLRAAATPVAFRARMAAGVAFLSSCLNPFATQGMGYLVGEYGAVMGVAMCGTVILVSTVLLLYNDDAKSLLTRSNEEIVGAYATLYPKAFIERQQPIRA
jgi:MFS transporter, DHA3 family, macrolide efflux protein